MKRILIILLGCSTGLLTGQNINAYWELAERPPGGGEFTLTKTSDGALYAIAFNQKVYKSLDNGGSWEYLEQLTQSFPVTSVPSIKVGEAGAFFADVEEGNSHRWYKTTDAGQTWIPLDSTILNIAITPNNVLIGQKDSSIVRSVDGGQSWNISLPLRCPAPEVTPHGGIIIRRFQNGHRMLYRSIDDGISWSNTEIPSSGSLFITPSGTILNVRLDTLYRSTDGGASFSFMIIPEQEEPTTFVALPSGRILMQPYFDFNLFGEAPQLYSDDDGLTWGILTTPEQGAGGSVMPVAANDGTIFKYYLDALLRSGDGGLTWQFVNTGIRYNVLEDIKFVSDSFFFAYTPLGLWRTADAGENWDLITQNNASHYFKGAKSFEITHQGNIAVFRDEDLLWSDDFGNSFSDITPPDTLAEWYGFKGLFLSPVTRHLFVNTLKGLERSTDFGQSWDLVLAGIWVADLGFLSSGRIIANARNHIFISDDDGDSWEPIQQFNTCVRAPVTVAPNGDIYLVRTSYFNNGVFWKSVDSGLTWVKLPADVETDDFLNSKIEVAANGMLYFATGYGDILLSADGGYTWQTVPRPYQNSYAIKLAISPAQHLYFCGYFEFEKSANPVTSGAFIKGRVYSDDDDDCTTVDVAHPFKNNTVSARNADVNYYTTTGTDGRYSLYVDQGLYEVEANNPHNIWWSLCDSLQTVQVDEPFATDTADFAAIALSDCPLMTVNVAAPFLRRCFDNEVFVYYCNQGSETADSAWVDLFLDPYVSFVSSLQPHTDLGNNRWRFFAGNIASGECGQFQLTVHVDCDSTVLGQTHCISAHGFPDTLCNTVPGWSGANIEASVECQDTLVVFRLQNTGPVASQLLDYIIIEDDVVMFEGQQQYNPGQSLTLSRPATGHTLRLESAQEPGHPFSTRALAFEEGCGGFESLGFINQFSVNGITPSWHRMCLENIGAYDPNDKHGYPTGTGAEHRIRPGQPIGYMIRFQNTGTDTAFSVLLRDTLSPWLNPAAVVPGAASHPYTWQVSGQGIITFTFANILLPDSTTNSAGSQGFISFQIAQQPDVPSGAQILNRAAIFFDFNAPVITNETLHTVGEDLVTSGHEALTFYNTAVKVAPNPAGAFVRFQLAHGDFKEHRLQLFDPLGKPVFETKMTGSQLVIPRGTLAAGAYGWRVLDVRGQLAGSGMVVFQ